MVVRRLTREALLLDRDTKFHAGGDNVGVRNHTLFATADGTVNFIARAQNRKYAQVIPL